MTNASGTQTSFFWSYIRAVWRYAPGKAKISLVLLIALGLAEGIGLLLIIPLLQIIGIGSPAGPGGISAFIGRLLALAGLPLTLPVILGVYVVLVATSAAVTCPPWFSVSSLAASTSRKTISSISPGPICSTGNCNISYIVFQPGEQSQINPLEDSLEIMWPMEDIRKGVIYDSGN